MAAESAVTLGTVLESVGSGVCVVELDGTVRVANKAFQELFGLGGATVGCRSGGRLRQPRAADRASRTRSSPACAS